MAQIITNFIGFETGDLQETVASGGTPTAAAGAVQGSSGSYGLRLDDGEDVEILLDPAGLKSSPAHFVVGFYIRFNKSFTTDTSLVRFKDATETMGSVRIQASDMKIKVGDIDSVYGTPSTSALTSGVWYKFEIRWYAANAGSGYGNLYIDGTLVANNTTGDFLGGAVPDRIRFANSDTGTNLVDIDHVYIKTDTAASTTADLIGGGAIGGDGLEWNVPGYYQHAGTGGTSAGTAPAAGSLVNTGELPINDANDAEWTGSADTADWATNGTVRGGPLTDIDETVAAAKWFMRADRDGGGGTTHTLGFGVYDPTTYTTEDATYPVDTVITDYFHLSESATYMPNATDEAAAFYIGISGAQDLHIYEAGAWIFQTFTAGPATITATGAFTLGAFTVAATAEVDIDGTGAFTLGAFTTNPNATAEVDIDAAGAFTLGEFTVDATAITNTDGAGAFTLGEFTVDATGTVINAPAIATGAFTLGEFTLAGTATNENDAIGAFTLGEFTVTGTADRLDEAVGAFTLGELTVAGTATADAGGVGAFTLGEFTVAGTVTVTDGPEGVGAFTLGEFTLAATAEVDIAGTGAFTLGEFTVAGTADRLDEAVGAFTLGEFTLAATATNENDAVGAFTLGEFTVDAAATGVDLRTATGAFTLGEFTLAGTGTQLNEAVGGFTLGAFTIAATEETNTNTVGGFTLGAFTLAGTGTQLNEAVGAFTLGAFAVAGTSTQLNEGIGGFTLGAFTIAGEANTISQYWGSVVLSITLVNTAGLSDELVNTVGLSDELVNTVTLTERNP